MMVDRPAVRACQQSRALPAFTISTNGRARNRHASTDFSSTIRLINLLVQYNPETRMSTQIGAGYQLGFVIAEINVRNDAAEAAF
jgi:hypothetical protein